MFQNTEINFPHKSLSVKILFHSLLLKPTLRTLATTTKIKLKKILYKLLVKFCVVE